MERGIPFVPGEYYHLYTRGVEKRDIFLDTDDYARFTRLLYACNSEDKVRYRDIAKKKYQDINRGERLTDIGAHCPMPNHLHLLVRESRENGISQFMERLLTAYSMYFNKKYERTGRLFHNTFQSRHVDSEDYLRYLFVYIHVNPIDLIHSGWKERGLADVPRAKKFLTEYKYSSYLDYTGIEREESLILSREAFPDYFRDPDEFAAIVHGFLK